MGFNVFNQKLDLAGHDVSLELMQDHAAGSQLVLALLSPSYFTSKYCRGELEGAKTAGVPIVPVFSGDHNTYDAMMDLLNKPELNEERLEFKPEDDDEKKAKVKKEVKEAVKAAFGENLLDVNNAQHADTVMANLKEKILGRYFAMASAGCSWASCLGRRAEDKKVLVPKKGGADEKDLQMTEPSSTEKV